LDVLSGWQEFGAVKAAMTAAGLTPEHAEVAMIPLTTVAPDADSAVAVIALIDQLEDLDDVQNVYTNADLSAAP
jgi:transcriptional/translational regulatory protein YebC/TACO1